MSTIKSLATKHRPTKLDHVVGQRSSVVRIKGMISSGKFPQGILLTGNTGTGKTTLSRIIASYANMKDGKPCSIEGHPDIKQVNAANVRKIEDIRQIIEEAKFRPQRGKYRIICMDEIQQITHDAAQALLATLEEPPASTMFILTSMEPERLNKAILGRCSIFQLELPDEKDIAKRLLYIAKKEKWKWFKKEHALIIAQSCNGQVRDAVAGLEAVSQFVEGAGKKEDIQKILKKSISSIVKVGDDTSAKDILVALYSGDSKELQKAIVECDSPVAVMNKLGYMNQYVVDRLLAPQAKGVAHWPINRETFELVKGNVNVKKALYVMDAINECKYMFGTFMATEKSIMTSKFGKLCLKLK